MTDLAGAPTGGTTDRGTVGREPSKREQALADLRTLTAEVAALRERAEQHNAPDDPLRGVLFQLHALCGDIERELTSRPAADTPAEQERP